MENDRSSNLKSLLWILPAVLLATSSCGDQEPSHITGVGVDSGSDTATDSGLSRSDALDAVSDRDHVDGGDVLVEPTCSVVADPSGIERDGSLTFTWTSVGAESCQLRVGQEPPVQLSACTDTMTIQPLANGIPIGQHVVTLEVSGPGGEATCSDTFAVLPRRCVPGGNIRGSAHVTVVGVDDPPAEDKEVIFCIGNLDTGFWVNVRHRKPAVLPPGSYYQIKGAFDDQYTCSQEWRVRDSLDATDGEWQVSWDGDTGRVTVAAPGGRVETITFAQGPFTITDIRRGPRCGGGLNNVSPAEVSIGGVTGAVPGLACPCDTAGSP